MTDQDCNDNFDVQRERYIGGKALDTVVEEIAHPLGAIWLDRRWTSYQQLADR